MVEMEKKFTSVGSLKVGGYVLIDGGVSQIKSIEKSKPGKHEAKKARMVAVDVFSHQKKNLLKPVSADAEVPVIIKGSAQVVAAMGETLQIMDMQSYETMDIPAPKDVTGLKGGDEVEYMRYGEHVRVLRKK